MTPDDLTAKMIAHHELWAVELAEMDSAEAKFHKDAAAKLREVAQQGKAGGVAVYEVQERMSSFAPSSRWTETTRETYEGGYFPETLFHRRILYATPPTHSPDAGVSGFMAIRAEAEYFKRIGLSSQPIGVRQEAMMHALCAALAPQPKDAT